MEGPGSFHQKESHQNLTSEGSKRRDTWTTVTPTAYRRSCSRVSSDFSFAAELSWIYLNFMAISDVTFFVLVCIERTVR